MIKFCKYCKKRIEEEELRSNNQQYHSRCFQVFRKEYIKKWLKENKEKVKEYRHNWIINNKEKNIENCKGFRKKHRNKWLKIHRLNQEKYRKRHPDRIKARNMANRFLKNFKKEGFEFHHKDYSKPLEVEIIPKKKHYEISKENRLK